MKLNQEKNKLLKDLYNVNYCLSCDHLSPDIITHLKTIHDDLCLKCSKCNELFINDDHFSNHTRTCYHFYFF